MKSEIHLSLKGLTAGYGGPAIVRDVDLDIRKARMITFVGPNGAGKSTLLRAIFGSAKTYSGTVELEGYNGIEKKSAIERLAIGVALVPQGRCNFGQMSVAENLAISAHTIAPAKRKMARERVIELFPVLDGKMTVLAGNLSGGEQQMLEMAMVLQMQPACLLVDEPSLGLSPIMQADIFAKLAELRDRGTTVIVVEQNVRAALEVSDDAAVLVQGEIVMSGDADEINNNDKIRHAYLGG